MENTHCSCKLTRVRSRRLDHLFNDRATAKKRLEADMVTYFGAIAPPRCTAVASARSCLAVLLKGAG